MRKRFLSLLTALCLMLTLAPVAFATDTTMDEAAFRNAVAAGGTVTLPNDITLTSPLTISAAVIIDGSSSKYSIIYDGSGSAISVTAQAAVTLKDLKIDAAGSGAYAVNLTSNQPNLTVSNCEIKADNRGISMYPNGGCTNGSLTIRNSTIKNSQITGAYDNNTTVGDTRGIALFDVKDSNINISNSHIYGFGYSINTSAPTGVNGVRPASNTYTITNSNIWGWSAFNIWTVGNTVNLTNCNVKGINPLTTDGNSFSVIVLNENIYGSKPASDENAVPNVFNITGGSYNAQATGNSAYVEETLFRIDEDYKSVFNFYRYANEETGETEYVDLECNKPFTAFIAAYEEMSPEGVGTWAASHVTGNTNTIYNWSLLAPGMYCQDPENIPLTLEVETDVPAVTSSVYEGGSNQ